MTNSRKPNILIDPIRLCHGSCPRVARTMTWTPHGSSGRYDANMTLGRTKNVDILISNPTTNRLYQLEVKTKLDSKKRPPVSKLFGRYLADWIMNEKHESISRPELWYCFVTIGLDSKILRYFIVPSAIVAKYVRMEHDLWIELQKPKIIRCASFGSDLRKRNTEFLLQL